MAMQLNPALRYLAVPLRTAPLLLILIFSLLFWIALKAGLLGIWLGFVLLSGFLNYGFILLDSAAGGEAEPPVLTIEMMNPLSGGRWMLMLVIVAGAFFITDAAVYWLEHALATMLGLAAAMLLAAKRYGEALHVTRERIKAYPEFRPASAAELIQLARLACDGGDRPTARVLLRNFQQFYPEHALRPVADDLLQQIAR